MRSGRKKESRAVINESDRVSWANGIVIPSFETHTKNNLHCTCNLSSTEVSRQEWGTKSSHPWTGHRVNPGSCGSTDSWVLVIPVGSLWFTAGPLLCYLMNCIPRRIYWLSLIWQDFGTKGNTLWLNQLITYCCSFMFERQRARVLSLWVCCLFLGVWHSNEWLVCLRVVFPSAHLTSQWPQVVC